ncbi:MAG: TIGR03013 family XrtA/PEP-CTERM system glycosyltransferase [Burkholderiaceae bacterium]
MKTVFELFADALICFGAVILAALTILLTSSSDEFPLSHALAPAALVALLTSFIYTSLGIYKQDSSASVRSFVTRFVVAVPVVCIPIYVLFYGFADGGYARHIVGYSLVYMVSGLVLVRRALFWTIGARFRTRRVLIIGTGPDAKSVAAELHERGLGTYEIVGFFPGGRDERSYVTGQKVFSRDVPFDQLVLEERVDEIIVAVKDQRGGVLPIRQLLECRVAGIPVRSLAEFYERSKGEVPLDSLKASWLIYGRGFTQNRSRTLIKRSFDVVVAVALIAVTWPIMLLTLVAILIEDGGPIMFRQERVGLHGHTFKVLKFRSMRTDAEKDGVARWATKNDSRITRVGAFIRKVRIDELPQLFNVLAGEMSLVGPRPERPTFVSRLGAHVPFYNIRHSVKPGVTGWAQVRFTYGASVEDARRKLQFDLYYVKNHSLFLDVLVILETVRVVLFREGAV